MEWIWGLPKACLCCAVSSLGFLVVFFFCFTGFLSFCFYFYSLIQAEEGFWDIFVPVCLLLDFQVGFLSFHEFYLLVLLSFLSMCQSFWYLFLSMAASTLSLYVAVLLFYRLSSLLLLCFTSIR